MACIEANGVPDPLCIFLDITVKYFFYHVSQLASFLSLMCTSHTQTHTDTHKHIHKHYNKFIIDHVPLF